MHSFKGRTWIRMLPMVFALVHLGFCQNYPSHEAFQAVIAEDLEQIDSGFEHDLDGGLKISAGFEINPSYGTIAVQLPDGSVLREKVDGDGEYINAMRYFSRLGNQHDAPPYKKDIFESVRDKPRRWLRDHRLDWGLPASYEVGQIAKMLEALLVKIEESLGARPRSASIAAPLLDALYQDDLYDAFAQIGLEYVFPAHYEFWGDFLFLDSAAYAGFGLGLCHNYTNYETCQRELNITNSTLPKNTAVLTIHYTDHALAAAFTRFLSPYSPYEAFVIDVDLGNKAGDRLMDGEKYWAAVRQLIEEIQYVRVKLDYIILLGDRVLDEKFQVVLVEAIVAVHGTIEGEVLLNNTVFAVAEGTAELRKRAEFLGKSNCNRDSGCMG